MLQLIEYIPVRQRQFYRDLKFGDNSDDEDYGLASGESDSE